MVMTGGWFSIVLPNITGKRCVVFFTQPGYIHYVPISYPALYLE